MKNIILAIAFCFSSTCAFAQKQFDGAWISDESNYITTIVSGEYGVVSVTNFNAWTGKIIKERIISRKKNKFTTELFNESNGYSVTVEYKMKHKDTLVCKFEGDLNKKITHVRFNNY
jgi:hypothetical protein